MDLALSCLVCDDRGRLPFYRKSSRGRVFANPWVREIEDGYPQEISVPKIKGAPPHTPDETRAALPPASE